MVSERLKYVTARPSLENPKRWYWQRPGHAIVRLPKDLTKRVEMVESLNAGAEGPRQYEGSVSWVVQKYRESDEYAALAEGTKKYYKRIMGDVERVTPYLPFADAFTRRVVIEFARSYPRGVQKQAGAVLRNLFNMAMYHGVAKENPARDLRIKGGSRRTTIFTLEQADAWLDKCGSDDAMRTAFILLQFTVQRPNDVLRMNWTQYDGDLIKLRQQKTKKLVDVPCHATLKAHLEAIKGKRDHTRIVANGFRGLSYTRFCVRFRRIADAAGLLTHQARDLRRTAAVMMAEAGANEVEISAVGGWSIEATRQILETYVVRTTKMARGAMAKWEQNDKKV